MNKSFAKALQDIMMLEEQYAPKRESVELGESASRETETAKKIAKKGKKLGDWVGKSYYEYEGNLWVLGGYGSDAVNRGPINKAKKTLNKSLLKKLKFNESVDELDEAINRGNEAFWKEIHTELKKVMDNKYYREFRSANGGQALDNVISHFGKARGWRVDRVVKEIIDKYGRNRDEYIKLSFAMAARSKIREDVDDEQTNDQLVREYLEGYFGGELNESISDDNIMEAFDDILETADAVREFMVEQGLVSTVAKHGAVGAARVGARAILNKARKIGPRNLARRHLARKKAAGLEQNARSREGLGSLFRPNTASERRLNRTGEQAARLRNVVGGG